MIRGHRVPQSAGAHENPWISHAAQTRGGRTLFLAGQVAKDRDGRVVGKGAWSPSSASVRELEDARRGPGAAVYRRRQADDLRARRRGGSSAQGPADRRRLSRVLRQALPGDDPGRRARPVRRFEGCMIEIDGFACPGPSEPGRHRQSWRSAPGCGCSTATRCRARACAAPVAEHCTFPQFDVLSQLDRERRRAHVRGALAPAPGDRGQPHGHRGPAPRRGSRPTQVPRPTAAPFASP